MVRSEFTYIPLRNLFFSLLNENSKKSFKDAISSRPERLVKTSVFCNNFWKTLSAKKRGSLTAEQAWFGIRSILKGTIGTEERKTFQSSDFNQLDGSDGLFKKRVTRDVFEDHQLKELIEVHQLYERWKDKVNFYDDMDLVRTAYRENKNEHIVTGEFTKLTLLKDYQIDEIVRRLNIGAGRFHFKQQAQKTIDKKVKRQDKTRDKELRKWMEKFLRKDNNGKYITPKGSYLGTSNDKFHIFKWKLQQGWRIFYSVVRWEGRETIVIYDICFNHDKQGQHIERALLEFGFDPTDLFDYDEEVAAPIPGVESIDETPGQGPTKSTPPYSKGYSEDIWDILSDPSNITATKEQKRAIINHQPLLIDGLPGTGKTSLLAKRAALRCALSSMPVKLLITCASGDVLDVIRDGIDHTSQNDLPEELRNKIHFRLRENFFPHRELNEPTWKPTEGYDEIIIDECQDLTPLELELLKKLTMSDNGLGDARRFTLAGDPQQTLNPTGFDWGKIRNWFIENGIDKEKTETSAFHKNYRSSKEIIDLANVIQKRRNSVLSTTHTNMIPDKGPKGRPPIYKMEDEEERNAILDALTGSAKTAAYFVCWASDDQELIELIKDDSLLRQAFEKEGGDIENISTDSFRENIILHSQTSIKGLEFDTIVLYKFASDPKFREILGSLTEKFDPDDGPTKEIDNYISIKYAFSRLYVSMTRAFENLIIIEDLDGTEFWRAATLGLEDYKGETFSSLATIEGGVERLNISKYFEDDDAIRETKYINDSPYFGHDLEASFDGYTNWKKDWETARRISSLQTAIHILEILMEEDGFNKIQKEELYELQGELAYEKSKAPGIVIENKNSLILEAAKLFEKAIRPEKSAPLYYRLESWENCLRILNDLRIKKPGIMIFKLNCTLKVDGAVNVNDIFKCLNEKTISDSLWKECDNEKATKALQNHAWNKLKEDGDFDNMIKHITLIGENEVLKFLIENKQHELVLEHLSTDKLKKRFSNYYLTASYKMALKLKLEERITKLKETIDEANRLDWRKTHLGLFNDQLVLDYYELLKNTNPDRPPLVADLQSSYSVDKNYNNDRSKCLALISAIGDMLERETPTKLVSNRMKSLCIGVSKINQGLQSIAMAQFDITITTKKDEEIGERLKFINENSWVAEHFFWHASENINASDIRNPFFNQLHTHFGLFGVSKQGRLLTERLPNIYNHSDYPDPTSSNMISLFGNNILDALTNIKSLDDKQSNIIYAILGNEDKIDVDKAEEWIEQLGNEWQFKLKLRIFNENEEYEEFRKEMVGTRDIPVEFTEQAEMYAALLKGSGNKEEATKITQRITNDYPSLINNIISQSDIFMEAYDKISKLLTANDEEWTIQYMNSLLDINSNNDSNMTPIKITNKEHDWMSILDENSKLDGILQLIDSSSLRFNNLFRISPTHLILYAVIKKRLDFRDEDETYFKDWIWSLIDSMNQDIRHRPGKTVEELENIRRGHSYIQVINNSCYDPSTDIQNMIDCLFTTCLNQMNIQQIDVFLTSIGENKKGNKKEKIERVLNELNIDIGENTMAGNCLKYYQNFPRLKLIFD